MVALGAHAFSPSAVDLRRALLACAAMGLGSVAFGLAAGLPIASRLATRLEVAAFSADYLASFCLLWATLVWLQAAADGQGPRAWDGPLDAIRSR